MKIPSQKQECFRARLTSKPWRCGSSRPPCGYPWNDAGEESRFRKWEIAYAQCDSTFKVCDLIAEFGRPAELPTIKRIIDIHDQGSRVESRAPLA